MKAYKLAKTDLLELRDDDSKRVEDSVLFKRFAGGIAWANLTEPDPYSRNWGVIVGEREDSLYTFFTEFSGDRATLADKMIEWKDRLLCSRFYASDEDEQSLLDLRKVDGLTHYKSHKDITDRKVYDHQGEHWPYFRGRENVASIIPVGLDVRGNLWSGHELVKQLVNTKKAKVRWDCIIFESLIYQNPPYDRILAHPCMQAAIYAVLMLERTKARTTANENYRPPVYGNLRG